MSCRSPSFISELAELHLLRVVPGCRAAVACFSEPSLCFCLPCQSQELEPRGVEACPCVWALQGSPLVPVGFDTQLVLLGRNLDLFEVRFGRFLAVITGAP